MIWLRGKMESQILVDSWSCKKYALRTGNQPLGSMATNVVAKITGHPDMILAVLTEDVTFLKQLKLNRRNMKTMVNLSQCLEPLLDPRSGCNSL